MVKQIEVFPDSLKGFLLNLGDLSLKPGERSFWFNRPSFKEMLSKPGTYVLILKSRSKKRIQIGRWGPLDIRPGYYLYVGSAFGPGGLLARVTRHCRENKSKHWHIDYLREHAELLSVWFSHDPVPAEHEWAAALAKMQQALPLVGIGCSDCACEAHLFFMQLQPGKAAFSKIVGRPVEEWAA